MALRKRAAQPKTLAPVHPNVGLQMAYQRKLESMVDDMHASLVYWLRAAYRANTPELAQDQSPAMALREAMRKLARRWQRNFDRGADDLAGWFAMAAADRSDRALKEILRKAGFSVTFTMSAEANDVMQATIGDNVALIKSIGSQHLTQVEGLVMRSVTTGRDLGTLTKELENQFGVTRRRAAFISLDQNNKATASITRVRQRGLGITEAIWMHSNGGKVPRPEHKAFSGKRYDIEKGAFLEGVWTWPGVQPRCRCVSRSVVPGFE